MMVTTGVDHSVLDRSFMILENEHARTEDKVAACTELEGYFNHLIKNKKDLLPSPFNIHGEKLIRTLLQCLEKDNSKLRTSVLLVLKPAVQLLPKGLGMGMQLASQCYAVLLKIFRATEENVNPSCKSQALVELFQCMVRFDDPQFLDAVMTATVRYSDHKELIEKCVNVSGETIDSSWNDQQDSVSWISRLRLEALHFAKRLMQVCGSLLRIQFEEDLDFWLELLLPQLFVFREVYSSALWKGADADTRKAGREALEAILVLTPKDGQLKLEKWPKIKKDVRDSYSDKMVKLVGIADDWAPIWCLVLDVLGAELIKKGNNRLINKLLNAEEKAFKSDRLEIRVQAFICWRHLIERLLPSSSEVSHDAIQRSVRLLVQPLQPNNAKTDIMSCQKLNTWWYLVQRLENCIEYYKKSVLVPFLVYCFGCAKSKELPPGKKFAVLHIPCAEALANILDHEPAKQQICGRQKSNEDVEEGFIHSCKVPVLNKPVVFLDVSEELLYSVEECAVILCSRSEAERCSQLLCRIWNSLLRHVTDVIGSSEIPAEKVAKLIQDLLRLLQNLTERSSSSAPALATHCIILLEGLVMGPNALPPAVLASPTYYVGTTQLMTGTAALFLLEVMVSRPFLQFATSHAQYIPVLKAILDVGISHHNVLEFMQSVMKQLETATSSYYNINIEERVSLCTVWSIVAAALTVYLKDQNPVNQGNEKHHDLSCFYLVVLFPFYHLYSITYKQAMEILPMWLELYKSFHQAAVRNVPTLDINEVCETVAVKICQALVKHCPTSANQAVPLLKAVQNIIIMIPYGDICGTQQSSKSKSRYLLLPDRGRVSKPTSYITNAVNLVVKVSELFPIFERSGEWYNTVGALIMSCLETLFKNMKAASVTAAIPMVASLSNSILSFLQVNPLQDGTTKFWHESLHRMWKCYFTFIETYLPQKSVKDFLGWMSALLEAGFRHPLEEIRNITGKFWDSVVVPAFAKDNTNVPQVLKEARENYAEKCGQTPNIFCIVSDNASDSTFSQLDDKGKPLDSAVFALPEETDKQSKHCQALLQQLQDEGHILTKHQKEVFRRRKDDIPVLYNSTIQPVQEDSLISESSQDTSDFAAPQRIIEPLKSNTITLEAKERLIASSLKVLEPPSSLQRLADYRKKMMIDHEGSIVLASISENNSPVSADVPEQPVSSHEILDTQVQAESEPPDSPLSLTLLSDPCEPTPLLSNGRKLNLEFVAVRLPTPISVPSKDTPELPESQLVNEQDISVKPEVAIRVSISTPAPTSVTSSGIDAPVSFPLEEPAVCSGVVMRSNEQDHPESHNILASPMKLQEIVELPAAPLTILTDKNISPKASSITSIVPGSRNPLLIEATSKNNAGSVQKVDHVTKSSRRKPVVVNTENPLTNYFKPVSITLTADDDEVDSSRKGSARTIHLSLETSDNNVSTSAVAESCLHNLETTYDSQILPNHTEIVEDNCVPSVSSVEVSAATQNSNVECEVSDWRRTLSPVKVVVEKVEDFILTKTFSALETTPPLNIEHDKELPLHEVSSSSRRKIKSPLKRNPGDPKLPPFKGNSKRIQQMQKKEQCKEVICEDKLSKSSSRLVKGKDSKKPKPLKRSSRSHSASKHGIDQVVKVTMEEAITGQETASVDNPSPSLLPVASGRSSRSVIKQTRSKNTQSEAIENDMAVPQNGEISALPTAESQQKSILHSHKILNSVEPNKCNKKTRKSFNIKDLNDCKQVITANNDSLPAHDKKQASDVKSGKQSSRGSSKARVRKVAGGNFNKPSNSESSEAVDMKDMEQGKLDSTEPMKPHLKLEETVQKVIKQNVSNSEVPSKLTNRESSKSNTEAHVKDVKFSKQNISNSDDALKVSPRKVLVTDTEICKQSVVNSIESLQKVHNEMLTNDVEICDPSPFNTNEFLAIGIQNETLPCLETSVELITINTESLDIGIQSETLPYLETSVEPVTINTESSGIGIQNETLLCLETSTETRTSEEDAYNLWKGQDDIVEKATESTDSHKKTKSLTSDVSSDKRDVKSVFPKVKLVKYTPALKTSVLQPKEERIISSNDTSPKPSTRLRKLTSKLKSSMTSLGSSGKEINQDKPADILGETACSLKVDSTLNTLLAPKTFSTETNELHITEMEHGERKSKKTQHNHSLVHIEDVSSERRKRKLNETCFEDDLNAVQMSSQRSRSSCRQSSSDTRAIEDNLVPLLKKGRKSSLSKNPEILASSTITTATREITVLSVTETTALLTSTEASAVTPPMLTAVVPAGCSSEESILPAKSHVLPELTKSLSDKSVEKEMMSVQSCEKEDFSVSVNASTDSFHKENNISVDKVTSHEKVITRRRSRYSAVNVNKTLHGIRPRKLRSSTTRLDEHIKDIIVSDTTGSGLRSMSSPQKPMNLHVPYLDTHKCVNSKYEASEFSEELDVQTTKTVSNVVTLSQKQTFKDSSMSKLGLKTSLQCEETTSCFSESEVTLPHAEIENTKTGPEEVQTDSQEVADSEDVIESSQDSSASSLIVSRLPLIQKCSVSVCRIDTNLEPGGMINVFQGDQKMMVFIPQDCDSPFKVFTPGRKTPTAIQQEKSAEATSEMGKTHHMKLLSATRSLYGKSADVNQMDSVQDKPNISLVSNSSIDESMKESAYKVSVGNISTTRNGIPRSEKQTIASKCEGNISSVAKTDTAESMSEQIIGTLTSKEGVAFVVTDHVPKSRSKQQIRMSDVVMNVDPPKRRPRRLKSSTLKSVDGVPPVVDDTSYLKFKYQSKSKSKDSIAFVTENNTSKSVSEQEFDKPTPVNSILMALRCDAVKLRSREQIDVLRSEDNNISTVIMNDVPNSRCTVSENGILKVGEEGTPKHRSKQQINTSEFQDNVSAVEKEDTLKPQSEQQQQINMSLSDGNVPMVDNEGTPKHQTKEQINTSESQDNVPTVGEEDILTPQYTSVSKVNVSAVSTEYTSKLRSKQQINTSKSDDDVSVVCKEDTPKLRSKQQITSENVSTIGKEDKPTLRSKQLTSTSESEESVSKIGKECILKPQCKKQVDTSVTNSNVSIIDNEDTPKLRSRQQVNTSKSVDKVSRISKRDTPKPQSKKQINISLSRDNISASMNEDTAKRRSKEQINASKSEDNVCEGDVSKSQSKQQINTLVSKGNTLMVDSEDIPKLQSKQPVSEDNVSAGSSEDTPKRRSKKQINTSKFGKEDALKPQLKQQINTSESECNVSRVGEEDSPKPQSKHKDNILSSITEDTQKPQSKQEINTSASEDGILITVNESASKPKSKQQINISKCKDNIFTGDTEIQGSKMVLLAFSEKVLSETEHVKDKAQHLVTPNSVSMNHCKDECNKKTKEAKEDNISKLDHITSSVDDSLKALTQQKMSDKGHCIDNISDINKALELNETNISKGDSKLSSPLQPRKRPASLSHMVLEVPYGQVDSNINDHVDTEVSKTKRLLHNAENVSEKSVCDRSPVSTPSRVKLCNNTSPDNDKTPSPSSPKSLLSSPRSLLRAFSSPLGSLESNQTQKSHHKRSPGGRAHYMVGLAVAVNDMGTLQASLPVVPQKSEEIRSIIAATPPSLPLSRKKLLYEVSDAGTESCLTPLERLQCSVSECETPLPSCISNLANIPYKRALKQSGEQGTPPSKKKRVWFPDPEVSGTRLFSAHDAVDGTYASINKQRSPHTLTRMLPGKRRKARRQLAAISSDTNIHDKSSVSALSTSVPSITAPCAEESSPQSHGSPDLTGVASQGSVEETATELLNSQDAFFPALMNCNHPIECVAPRLTTHVMWTKALVVELTRKNIHTVGDLSRLDEASINRLPIANPKISHAKAILQDYMKSLEVENDRSPNIISKGGVSRSEDAHLEPEYVLSSPSETQLISTADVVKFIVSNKGSLATVLEEASKVGHCSQRLHQEVLSVLNGSNWLANTTSEKMEESVSDAVARFGHGAVLDYLMNSDSLDKLPKMEIVKYFMKHDPDGLCKILSESSTLANKAWQSYLYDQLASGQLCHKDLFDKLLSADCNNTLLSTMQSFIMLKRSTEEILQKMPLESVVQYAASRLSLTDKIGLCVDATSHDTSTKVPVSHYQKLVQAVAKKVTQREFTTIYYNAVMDNLS